jgi:hypothetical protein
MAEFISLFSFCLNFNNWYGNQHSFSASGGATSLIAFVSETSKKANRYANLRVVNFNIPGGNFLMG